MASRLLIPGILTAIVVGLVASTRRVTAAPPPSPPPSPAPGPQPQQNLGDQVRIGNRFEADLSGYLGLPSGSPLAAPGQIFTAIAIRPSTPPMPAVSDVWSVGMITGRHETTGRSVDLPTWAVTRIL